MKDSCICITKDYDGYCAIYKHEDRNEWILSLEGNYNYDSDFQEYHNLEIEYCPFCGRKLE